MVDLPYSAIQVLIFIGLVVPGLVFTGMRARLRGKREVDRSVASRIVAALTVSVILDVIYLAVLSTEIPKLVLDPVSYLLANTRQIVFAYLVGAVVVPAALAWVIYGDFWVLSRVRNVLIRVRRWLTPSTFEATPTAWDFAASTSSGGVFVRVRRGPMDWVGGRMGDWSYYSTYPEPRDLFIEEQFHMSKKGEFLNPVKNGRGLWLAIRDDYLVEWQAIEEDSNDK